MFRISLCAQTSDRLSRSSTDEQTRQADAKLPSDNVPSRISHNVRHLRFRLNIYIYIYIYIYSPKASVKSLSTIPQIPQTRSELETEVLIVSRYIVAAHRGNTFLLGRVLALRVASHRFRRTARRRRCITRQGIVVIRRGWTSPTVLAAGRFHVEHGRVRLDIRINLKPTIRHVQFPVSSIGSFASLKYPYSYFRKRKRCRDYHAVL